LPKSPSKRSSAGSPEGPRRSLLARPIGRCEPPRHACDVTRHLRSVSEPESWVAQFALPLPALGATVFRRDSFDRGRRGSARGRVRDGPRWLCGPPAPFGWGSPHHALRSLASSVATAVLSRDLHVSRSPPCALLSLDIRLPAAARTRSTSAPFRARPPLGPGRLRSVWHSTSRSSEAGLALTVTFARFRLTPFRPARGDSASSRLEPPHRATSRLLGSPRGSPRSHEEDAPHRRLLPTLDTSTRGSPGSRARGFRLADRPTGAEREPDDGGSTPDHLAAIRPQVERA